ncbi:unnamed protein product [Nyctereutes procyonoides]|uniref:(raccoon dog) hypothetical protein n=1 Tax=Nyctereutes procyonoides TaxID=34880 RepID=A0A811ZWE2_NYCPR|nr:unnamed protein product [Nyctereutes procyonoides]
MQRIDHSQLGRATEQHVAEVEVQVKHRRPQIPMVNFQAELRRSKVRHQEGVKAVLEYPRS